MISLYVLEGLESANGLLVGLQHSTSVLYLGQVPADTQPRSVPLGLTVVGSLQAHEKYPLHTLTKTKVEKLKNNQARNLKELRLMREPNQYIKIVGGQAANEIVQHLVCLASRPNPNTEKLLGYRYKQKPYLTSKFSELYSQLHKDLRSYLASTKYARENSKIIVQPYQFELEPLCTLVLPAENTLVNGELAAPPKQVLSFLRIEQLTEPSESDLKVFLLHLNTHSELVYQSTKEPLKQALPELLKGLPVDAITRMFNIHQYLPIELLWQHMRYLVRGRYHFHHYLEEQFNDKGWGCAYRAGQTVLSWFNEQRYSNVPIPSIRDMQRMLFDIDKSRNLVNTSEWIGANEVGWIISKICGVECKIVHLSDGLNIMEKVEQLRHHLQTSGCPIMYGGDNYAFTIVGLNYSWETGECEFLIVDPHYTDENTSRQVVSKEGVYWRDKSKLFKKGCYYNFCLPQILLDH